ncbi:MAG: GNAT family N-acetyltransferase [Sphingobacteriales bacterium]|nr:MAG: GNAT family N-acetyltransferase [Sphingobacteriales bacterium]
MIFVNQLHISYKINTATTGHVLEHFKKCNDQFLAGLKQKINLEDYAKKITTYAVMFEAWREDELSGLIAAYFNQEKKEVFITNVSVISQYMRRGIASQLMEECMNFAKANHCREISLRVISSNTEAISLYSKFGFKQTKKEYDELVMQKKLN